MTRPMDALSDLWRGLALPEEALGRARLTGEDPVLPSSFRVGTAATAAIGAAGLAAAEIWHRRTGRAQTVSVDMAHAIAEFHSEHLQRVNGVAPGDTWDPIAGAYRCGDGSWVRLHANFPHHRDGFLELLGAEHDRASVARALESWTGPYLDEAAAEAGLPAAMMRTLDQWDAHPQARAIAPLPVISITRIGDAPPEPFPNDPARPLSGVRALDLTRVIAGPVSGRILAAHGADVLLVTGPHLPSIPYLVVDTGRGKLSTHIDLRAEAGRETLRDLIRGADLFVQGYRPGTLAARGFGPADTAALRPGIIHVSLSAYGETGPWHERRGFDSLVQTASGLNDAEAADAGSPGKPRPLPVQALDHGAGTLMAFGAMAALLRRAEEGGSWHVQVSLARTALWLRSLGRIPGGTAATAIPTPADAVEESDSGFGRLTATRHAAILSDTPAYWARPSVPLGTHPARWP
ncbi:CoA transferase [Muricoccus radiodurans]|uniref:CoA transferase n=1 Tax=Muricoccus radiodurans TaxID=2231721 RepID=UPI003CE6DDB2